MSKSIVSRFRANPSKSPPELRDFARSDMVEDETGYGSLSSGWGNPLKLALVSALTCPPLGNPRPFGHQLIGSGVPVGKRASQAGGKSFQVVEADLPHSRQNYRRSGSSSSSAAAKFPLFQNSSLYGI
jgi:hypothetical protein